MQEYEAVTMFDFDSESDSDDDADYGVQGVARHSEGLVRRG